MIRVLVAGLGLLLIFSPCYSQTQSTAPRNNRSHQLIKKLERELEAALSKGNRTVLERLVANDYIEINPRGEVTNKRVLLSLARVKRSTSVDSVGPEKSVDDLTIRLHGDTALVTGRTTIRYQFMEYQTTPGASRSQRPDTVDQERFIRTYARIHGRWQLVAWQTTAIAKR